MTSSYSGDEMLIVAASRAVSDDDVCFVGIGQPSAACNLARLTHAPQITLIYESGTIAVRPTVLPLSIGDGELCSTALTTVSVPEFFRYWLQGGRITVGFLGAAQLDRFGNINTTVIGPYAQPTVRLPGAGGAADMAVSCQRIFVVMPHSRRGMVDRLDFITSIGHGAGGDSRRKMGITTEGTAKVITDFCIMEPDSATRELTVTSLHPGITREAVTKATGWPVRFAAEVSETPPPTDAELDVLRTLRARTATAHGSA
jgi:glutaconate CoA-transferase subunit B